MLPKRKRLTSSGVSQALRGKNFYSTHFSLKVSTSAGGPRFAAIVAKKIERSSVNRNRTRRRIYEIIKEFVITKPQHVIVSVKKSILEEKTSVLKDELAKLFIEASIS
ncbi:ribonuclease P protein component [Candidatus Parcubacteria bacterium]|nr:ribonuclease P protein component [Candidatus Parcubacteria bacterium]